jgi:hypothetical protein
VHCLSHTMNSLSYLHSCLLRTSCEQHLTTQVPGTSLLGISVNSIHLPSIHRSCSSLFIANTLGSNCMYKSIKRQQQFQTTYSHQYLSMSMKYLLEALLLFIPYVSPSPWGFPNDSDYTSVEPDDLQKTCKVRIAVLTCSGVSVIASLVVLYWLCRMETQFRHRSASQPALHQLLIA